MSNMQNALLKDLQALSAKDQLWLDCQLALKEVGIKMTKAGKPVDLALHEFRNPRGERFFAVEDRLRSYEAEGEPVLGMVTAWIRPGVMLECLVLWQDVVDQYFRNESA
jgi:hypothetical protein